MKNQHDRFVALIFGILTIVFIYLMTYDAFFDWAFARHQNQLSWYTRPLFLIPFCFFAFKRSLAGVFISLFAMLTSMFWFPQPEQVAENVKEFLEFERQYLQGEWTPAKILLTSTIPISLFLLAFSFWKRNLWFGLTVIVLMALGKILWSVQNAGESGQSIIIPAILGLLVCIGLLAIGFRRLTKSTSKKKISQMH